MASDLLYASRFRNASFFDCNESFGIELKPPKSKDDEMESIVLKTEILFVPLNQSSFIQDLQSRRCVR